MKNTVQSEIQGFSRTLAELEWLVLVLVLLYFVVPSNVIVEQWEVVLAMVIYASFIISFRYSKLLTEETRWKLAVETWAITLFITWCVYKTGGIESPLINLYLLVIIFSALTLGKLVTLLEFILITAVYFYLGQSVYYQDTFSMIYFSEVMMLFVPYLLVGYLTSLLAADLKNARKGLELLSDTDELTGLKNRRAFNNELETHVKRGTRYKNRFSVLMLDADNLKSVNDSLGHAVGDKLIISIAQVIQEALRETDVLARYGGDEFVVILSETTEKPALEIAERIRSSVENTSFSSGGERVSSTISIGISCFPDDSEIGSEIIARADSELYKSKRKGKNAVSR